MRKTPQKPLVGFVALVALAAAVAGQEPVPAPHRGVVITGEAPEGLNEDALQCMREIEEWRGRKFKDDVQVTCVVPEAAGGAKLAGWYEPGTHRLVVVKKGTDRFQRGTLLHELVHALQDQHFDLTKERGKTKDARRALQALIEGEAMLAVNDLMNYDFAAHAKLPEEGKLDEERFKKIFEYGTGAAYVRALVKRGGFAEVDRAYAEPPKSTAEIFHPELRFDGPRNPPAPIPPPSLPGHEGRRSIIENEPDGEYGVRLFLAKTPGRRSASLTSSFVVNADSVRFVTTEEGRRRHWTIRFRDSAPFLAHFEDGHGITRPSKVDGNDITFEWAAPE